MKRKYSFKNIMGIEYGVFYGATIFKFGIMLTLIFIFLKPTFVVGQTNEQKVVLGIVMDSVGKVISGVTINNTRANTKSTLTDENGRFVLEVEIGDSLRFSSVGFQTQTIYVKNNLNKLKVILSPAAKINDDVVVVAYGRKERKEAVVGSVTSIAPGDLKIPSSNLTNALAGHVAGLISYQRSGL